MISAILRALIHCDGETLIKLRQWEKPTKFEKISHLFWQNSCLYSVASEEVGDFFNSLLKPNYFKKLSYLHGVLSRLNFSFSEKATTFWKNLPFVLTLLSKDSCFVKTGGRFFQILWPSYNVWTLVSCIWDMELVSLVLHCNFAPVLGNWTWWRRTLLLKITWL